MIIFLKPNDKARQFQQLSTVSAIEPPLWLTLAARRHTDSIIIDAEAENLSFDETVSKVSELSPCQVVILPTGNHPSANIQQKEIANDLRSYIPNCRVEESLWFNPIGYKPRYELLDESKYRCHNWHGWSGKDKSYGVVFTSISCPMKCKFCQVKSFYNSGYRARNIGSVVQDFEHYISKGITNIKITDELFITKNKRTLDILKELIVLHAGLNIWAYARLDTINMDWLPLMKESGINWLGVGIESGCEITRAANGKGSMSNQEIKDKVKAIQDAGINVAANFIFGFPPDTLFKMHQTLGFAYELNCEYSNFYTMMAYPGTELYKLARKNKWDLPETSSQYSQYSYDCLPLRTNHLLSKDVLEFRDRAFKIYHSSSLYQSKIKKLFGQPVVDEINKLLTIPLKRKLYETVKNRQ